ncbi:hypothetical protein H072_5271 [Dactylellina haptotyla CBS 200.50]|uniref:SnoaL-like domain-containing protein n=1 Tax=Dactylellina haptotyla (strain CBS 200.50) TaxID=1284197 RepID=S8BZL1_DACHA|nr:hypothetical protein H072_5271 [Dactylellina haptotyla CBS 200.50]
MSYPTVPAYQAYASGSESLPNDHPVLAFLNSHQEAFDHGNMKNEPYTVFHTDDFTFTKTDGTVLPPGEESWKGWLAGYAPFVEHLHKTRYACVYERNGEWEMFGFADICANLPVPGEKTKTDSTGRKWDVMVPGAFKFTVVNDTTSEKGYKIKTMTVFGDGVPVVGEMMKRGMIKPEDLGK